MASCVDCELPLQANEEGNSCESPRCDPCATLSESNLSIRITPLKYEDLELVLAWRSNPEIYQHFRQQESHLNWKEHVSWFESRSSERYDFLIHYKDRRVGVVSIDSDDEVGIYLGDFSAQGRGIATTALRWLCNRFSDRAPLFAEIHTENNESKQLFRRCEFQEMEREKEWLQYVYDPESATSPH